LPGLRLIGSNRLEILSQALVSSLREPLSSPLTPEVIVVQSRGMQRWLSFELWEYGDTILVFLESW
jgi:exodeoxyribonuclease V gamma subunit